MTIDYTFDFELDLGDEVEAIEEGLKLGLELAGDLVARDAKTRAPSKTGALRASIQRGPVSGSLAGDNLEVEVGAGVPYAPYVEKGTGIHGEGNGPYPIFPVNRQALRFAIGGKWIFAKNVLHWGIKPQPYLTPAAEENEEKILSILDDAVELALAEAEDE